MQFELFKNRQDEWCFRIRAKNGRVVAQSEGYKNKQDALDTVRSLRFGCLFAKVTIE